MFRERKYIERDLKMQIGFNNFKGDNNIVYEKTKKTRIRKSKILTGLKWFIIATILLLLTTSLETFLIQNTSICCLVSFLTGSIIGGTCTILYLDEVM